MNFAINSVTWSTKIYIFHIIGICTWTNVPAILFMCPTACLLYYKYRPSITIYISQKIAYCNINVPCYCHICVNNKYVSQIPHIYHMLELPKMHQWVKYANTYVTYELPGINHVTTSAVHRRHSSPIALAELAIGEISHESIKRTLKHMQKGTCRLKLSLVFIPKISYFVWYLATGQLHCLYDVLHIFSLIRFNERVCKSFVSSSTRTTTSMHIVFIVIGAIKVDYQN